MIAIAWLPYGAWWSTPFARWQGAFAELHSLRFAAWTAKRALAARAIDPAALDFGVLGFTVPQRGCFYGLPWVAGELGAGHLAGPTVMQACATSVRCLETAAREVAGGGSPAALVLACDRVSNGPHLVYPRPSAPGGSGEAEIWVLDNFGRDPWAGCAMVDTAEAVAAEHGVSREAQDEATILRYEQYAARPADFHARFMDFDVPDARFGKIARTLGGDEGVQPLDVAKLKALKPVREGGTVTFAGQTHPADGNAGALVCSREAAAELQRAPVEVALTGFGTARVDKGRMPAAPVPAARRALDMAGLTIGGIDAVATHNPFAVNDIVLARETGFALERMNANGCSLVWGHPQGPTGLRAIIELVETLAARGGGRGLFAGCAAGDTAMAATIEVRDARTA